MKNKFLIFLLVCINIFCNVSAKKHETEHFKIFYPDGYEVLSSDAVSTLERNYKCILSHLECADFEKVITVKIYSSLEDFHKAIGWTDAPAWVKGKYQENLIEIVAENQNTDRMLSLVTHELTHIVTHNINSEYIPSIIFEGIATYEAKQYYLESELNNLDKTPTIDELFSLNHTDKNLYPLAYTFVKFVIENYGYEKIVWFLKINYNKCELDFSKIQDVYSGFVTFLESVKGSN